MVVWGIAEGAGIGLDWILNRREVDRVAHRNIGIGIFAGGLVTCGCSRYGHHSHHSFNGYCSNCPIWRRYSRDFIPNKKITL